VASPLPVPTAWYAIPLRLIVGFGFLQHGYAKLARGPEYFIDLLHAIGLPGDVLLGWATIIVEIIGGLLILFGALVPLATVPMAIVLLVAIVTVHLPNGFSSIKLEAFDAAGAHFGQPGYETDLLYLAGLVGLSLGGAGPISIDRILRRHRFPSSRRKITARSMIAIPPARDVRSHKPATRQIASHFRWQTSIAPAS
jgi:putative oxidoreductase